MNIVIRRARKGDGKGIVACRNEGIKRKFEKYTGANRLLTSKDIRRYDKLYGANKKNEFVFIAIDKDKSKIVGSSGFFAKEAGRTRHRGEVGWSVHPDYVRRRIGARLVKAVLREAKNRGFKRAQAEVVVENVASLRLAKLCGFEIEGRRAGLLLDSGRYIDTYLFGKILK